MFGIGLVGGRFEYHGEFIGIQHDEAADRDDSDAGHEQFHEVGSKDLPALANMKPNTLEGEMGSRRYTRDEVIAS